MTEETANSNGTWIASKSPIKYIGEKVIIDYQLMFRGKTYPLTVGGHEMIITKGADKTLNFYAVEEVE